MDIQRRQFQLNLPGLLTVLAEHLYSNRKVALRELLQNAQDSIVRYQVSEPTRDYEPRIHITTNRETGILTIDDNGAGMTDADIIDYLTTIGGSYTRELGTQIAFTAPRHASLLIGQFGLGFLSAFLAASEVRLRTRVRGSETGWSWRCDGEEYYEMVPDDDPDLCGTVIELRLKPETEFLLDPGLVANTIRQYADFLQVPIYLNDEPASINQITPPWQMTTPLDAIRDYIDHRFHVPGPLHIIELRNWTVDLGHDVLLIPMQGFVFIPPVSMVSLREYGYLTVYIRRMFITDHEEDLLPPWARFFRGVIDCPLLQPTASRESIQQDDIFQATRQALEQQLLEGLRQVASENTSLWSEIIFTHADLILGWLTVTDEFFDEIADLLPLHTSRGMLTLPEYLHQTGDTLYYVTQQIGSLQEQLIGEGYEVPVIDASWFAVRPFLEKYAGRQGTIRLIQMDGDSRGLLKPITDNRYDGLVQFFRDRDIKVKVAVYKPVTVPALLLFPRYADTVHDARRARDSGELASPFAALIEEYLKRRMEEADDDPAGVLYLNSGCTLIQRLSDDGLSPVSRDAVLTLIYQIARLFAGHTLTPQDASQAFDSLGGAIQTLLV